MRNYCLNEPHEIMRVLKPKQEALITGSLDYRNYENAHHAHPDVCVWRLIFYQTFSGRGRRARRRRSQGKMWIVGSLCVDFIRMFDK